MVLLEYDACRLFVERARVYRHEFMLTRQNASAVNQVCRRLDGIPLALELAAARVKALPVEQIATRLDDRFRLLTGGNRTSLPRQQTLRALIDWSYDLLNEQERLLLCRLSVFAGGWTLEAAEQVCAGGAIERWEVMDLLTSLVDKSLVIYEEQANSARYRLLETIRQYAHAHLSERREGETILEQHQEYFLNLAAMAKPQLHGAAQAEWLERLETEHDNLRAVLDRCLSAGKREKENREREEEERAESKEQSEIENQQSKIARAGLRLAGLLYRFWEVRGYLSEGRERLAAVLAHPGAQERSRERADVLNGSGYLAWRQGDYAAAYHDFDQSLAIGRGLNDTENIAASVKGLAIVAYAKGDLSSAASLSEQCLRLLIGLNDNQGSAGLLSNLGVIAEARGNYTEARERYEQSLAIYRELGNSQGIALILGNLGSIAFHTGDYTAAWSHYQQSLAIRREMGDKLGSADSLYKLGSVAQIQADFTTATALYEEALAINRELGNRAEVANNLICLGIAAKDQGNFAAARDLYQQSLTIMRDLDNKQGIAITLVNLGPLACTDGDFASAHRYLTECLQLCRSLGIKRVTAYALEGMALLAQAQDRQRFGASLYAAAAALRESIRSPLPPNGREEYERDLTALREALGEEVFLAAWEQGCAMTWEQAIEYALQGNEL